MQGTPSATQKPAARDITRRDVLRFFCLATFLFSAFAAMQGVLIAATLYEDNIPPGVVQSVGHVKGGFLMTFADGSQATFPYAVAYERADMIHITPGTSVGKQADTIAYFVNGRVVTDRSWLVRRWLFSTPTIVLFTTYLALGNAYALTYRRSAIGDLLRGSNRDRPRFSFGRAGLACTTTMLAWVVGVGLLYTVFGFITFGVGGAIRSLHGGH